MSGESRNVPMRMSDELIALVDKAARRERKPRSTFMRDAVKEDLRRRGLWPPTVEVER